MTITLYHGTTRAAAESLLAFGWAPHSGGRGGQCGQPRFLYLTNGFDNALWFAQQKGDTTVLAVEVPLAALRVDPEDGICASVAEELDLVRHTGLPGNVVLTQPLGASGFCLCPPPLF